MELKIIQLHPDAIVPLYATAGAACFDLHAVFDKPFTEAIAEPGGPFVPIRTGLAFEIPAGWAMKVYSRSGHGFKHGIRLVNGTGIIDSDYRGEVMVGLHNDGGDFVTIKHGDRIAQAMLVPVERVEFVLVDTLSETVRGVGGFGSTGN
jgi:dUTP pyrophosphatase